MAENPEDLHVARPRSFYGVYILCNRNPKYLGSTYIGFTVNPARRIRQHNREIKGGAWRTGRGHGPWDMVLITHGFNTKLAALQFEWAWQNPHRSRRLKHLNLKQTCRQKKDGFVYGLRVLSEMLNTGPWNRLPLTIQWLKQEYIHDFPVARPPPTHMPIAYGEIKTLKAKDLEKEKKQKNDDDDDDETDTDKENSNSTGDQVVRTDEKELNEPSKGPLTSCNVCNELDQEDSFNPILHCIVDTCPFVAHMRCYSNTFLKQKMEMGKYLIPVFGECPLCKEEMSWADVIKQKRYTLNLDDVEDEEEEDIDEDENIGGTQACMSESDDDDDFQ